MARWIARPPRMHVCRLSTGASRTSQPESLTALFISSSSAAFSFAKHTPVTSASTVARRGVSGCRAVSTKLDTAAQRSLLSATHSTRYDHTCEPSRRSSANPHCPISVLLLAARSACRVMNDIPCVSLDRDCGKILRLSSCLPCTLQCEL